MTQAIATVKKDFITQFESAQNQQSLQQYFDADATGQKLFTQVVIRAVQENPDLLNADRTSLFLACQAAAQDRLLPDRKDGALVIYNTKVGQQWIKKVQWQPMIGGIRKKLANHGFSIRAEVVYANDQFAYEMGDEPKIVHRPAVFGDRGAIVGAYAIATDQEGNMYRETMDIAELEKVRAASKSGDSGPWKDWYTEMIRKTVAKRLFKQLPLISTDLADLIDRDNEQYEMAGRSSGPSEAAQRLQEQVRSAQKPIEGQVVTEKPAARKKAAPKQEEIPVEEEPPPETGEDYEERDPLA